MTQFNPQGSPVGPRVPQDMTHSLGSHGAVSLLPIRKILEISTGHIPKHTADALGHGRDAVEHAQLWNLLPYEAWSDFGWIICISDVLDEVREQHPELAKLLDFCLESDIGYLQLDADGLEIEGFPLFDW